MYLDKIIKYINKLVSNTSSFRLSYEDLDFYLDRTVDHINQTLLTNFRTISEYFENSKFYNSVDKYVQKHENYKIEAFIFKDSIYNYDPIDNKIYMTIGYDNNKNPIKMEFVGENNYTTYLFYISEYNIFITYLSGVYDKITEENSKGIPIYETINELGYSYFNYNEFPDRYIRNCVIYYAAGLYLEEEDELENQHDEYIKKANEELVSWEKEHFSCYEIGTGKAVIYEQ